MSPLPKVNKNLDVSLINKQIMDTMLRCKILLVILILLSKISATEIVINAMIADSVSQTGIPNVNIFIYQTSIGTITDQDGRFRLVIPERYKNSQLVISHIAYPLKMIPVVEFETNKLILGLMVNLGGYFVKK